MIPAGWFAAALCVQAAVFLGAILWLLWTHARERKDLLDRLMARDFAEYQAAANPQSRDPHRRHNPIALYRERQRQQQQSLASDSE